VKPEFHEEIIKIITLKLKDFFLLTNIWINIQKIKLENDIVGLMMSKREKKLEKKHLIVIEKLKLIHSIHVYLKFYKISFYLE